MSHVFIAERQWRYRMTTEAPSVWNLISITLSWDTSLSASSSTPLSTPVLSTCCNSVVWGQQSYQYHLGDLLNALNLYFIVPGCCEPKSGSCLFTIAHQSWCPFLEINLHTTLKPVYLESFAWTYCRFQNWQHTLKINIIPIALSEYPLLPPLLHRNVEKECMTGE